MLKTNEARIGLEILPRAAYRALRAAYKARILLACFQTARIGLGSLLRAAYGPSVLLTGPEGACKQHGGP
eukprot:6742299-Alexandrium_andersonii.AAC.1